MKNKVSITLVLVLLISLQMTVLCSVKVCNVKPNVLLIFMLFLGVCASRGDLFFGGVLAGVMQDFLSSKVIGMYLIANVLFCVIMYSIRRRSYRKDFLVFLFVAFVSFLLYDSVAYFLTSFPRTFDELFFVFENYLLIGTVYNTVCACVVFAIMKRKKII